MSENVFRHPSPVFEKTTVEGILKIDMHGKYEHKHVEKIRENNVINHIKTFKVQESHYVRKSAKEQFLPPELSIKEMHRLYIE